MHDPRFKTDLSDAEQVAHCYGVDVEAYLRGQRSDIADAPFEV